MAGTTEGGKKAAKTRKQRDPQAFQKMGEKGGHARQGQSTKSSRRKSSRGYDE